MAKTAILKAEERKRTGSGLLKQMRKEGWVPSIVYGGGQDNRNLKIDAKTFGELLSHSASENFLVDLEIEGGTNQLAFVQDVQHDPLTGGILHADFLAVNDDTAIHAQLPIVLEGEPAGVKMGGLLEQHLHSLNITCLPKDLPETINSGVEHLKLAEALVVGDLNLPEGVTSLVTDDVVIAIVAKTRTAKSEGGADEGGDGEGEGGES
ncbi:MAG: 50S ribosomal protein L25 [Verrucomicrobiota bacterium]